MDNACGCGPAPQTGAPTVSPSPNPDGSSCVGPPPPHGGEEEEEDMVVKRGYLGKAERHRRRYFVLRGGGRTGRPARLEWYGTEEEAAAMSGAGKRRVICLRCCLGVSKVSSARKGHATALYTKDYTLVMVAADPREQEEWYWAVRRLMEEERRCEDMTAETREGEDQGGDRLEEEDDGYCTLTSGVFKEVWPVTVKPRGLGRTNSLAGEMRLCLSENSLVLVRVGGGGGGLRSPTVTLPLLSVRRFGHREGMFFLELGRSAPHGPGEVWMEAKDQGDWSVAQQVHEAVRDAVRALRVLPDFRRSPVAADNHQNGLQPPPGDKRIRARYWDKVGRVTPAALPLALPTAAETVQSEPVADACDTRSPSGSGSGSSPVLRSHLSSATQTSSYMEMAVEGVSVATVAGETYMTMSPQGSRHAPHREDYVNMASPLPLPPWPDLSTCMSPVQVNRFSSDDHQSYPLTFGTGRPDWFFPVFRQREPPDPSQSELLNSSSDGSQGEEKPTCHPTSWPVRAGLSRYALRRYVISCLPCCLRHDEDQ
ncbi:unnamed protein product [Merluccius merluccius]